LGISLNKDRGYKNLIYIEAFVKEGVELDSLQRENLGSRSNIISSSLCAISKTSTETFSNDLYKKLLNEETKIEVRNRDRSKIIGINKNEMSIQRAYLTGIKVEISGKLTTQRLIPRKTTYNFSIGSISERNLNTRVNKNRDGQNKIIRKEEEIIPRDINKVNSKKNMINKKVDYSQYTRKTKKGAYTVKV
jgi:Mitochondrial ribosomal protein (VAR1)